jgi:hypothetical protein
MCGLTPASEYFLKNQGVAIYIKKQPKLPKGVAVPHQLCVLAL